MRSIPILLIVALLAFLLGIAAFWGFSNTGQQVTKEEATILLERVRKVTKLVTVEGDVSEIFNSGQTRDVTFYLPLPTRFTFRKEAMVQVQGTVLVGYDLEQLEIHVDEATRTVTLSNFPDPEILAIDHELVYRNLEESWFNTFTAEDYSLMNKQAKERLRDKALSSHLIDKARTEGNALIETITFLVEASGYTLVLEAAAPVPPTLLE
ncbi:DUF4230 domain-containing protein [Neolewinella lacunae]|uniref:DUF4230 domain-containing protein n=1 Tax=Neolewinella lacunae TaxID=1517758 RepID=A0A923TEA3_9BACT|nr:DUF4230 domain-containing protein [Neolewinella lacunae]MBC6995697.1 DUF4230 domain-containing protein [Neolewinella lacunae]MDN3636610.1 DUF4230 domain-containing protein [Neolewinella lacunae]